jgi:hypothetical protein
MVRRGDQFTDEVAIHTHRRQWPVASEQETVGTLRVLDGLANVLDYALENTLLAILLEVLG